MCVRNRLRMRSSWKTTWKYTQMRRTFSAKEILWISSNKGDHLKVTLITCQFTPMMCSLFQVNATWYAVSAVGAVSSMARLTMEMFTWVLTNYWIPRHHAADMKNSPRRRRIQTRSSCMVVAYAVNHFQRRKKQYIASTVTDFTNFKCSFTLEQCFSQ